MNILRNKAAFLLLLPRFFQEGGEGESLRELFASTDSATATESELRALHDRIVTGVIRWMVRASFSNWN